MGKRQATQLNLSAFQRNEATPTLAAELARHDPAWRHICTFGYCATSGVRHMLQWPFQLLPDYRRELAAARRNRGGGWASESDAWGKGFNATRMPGAPQTPPEWEAAWEELTRDENTIVPFVPDAGVDCAVRFVISRVRAAGGDVVLVNMPLLPRRKATEQRYGYDAYLQWLRGQAAAAQVRLVDLNAPSLTIPDGDFKDTDHLSATGSARMTQRLTREWIVPALASGQQEARRP